MVYPSAGCRTCKKRRVKCDTCRPVCDRCRKANRSCDWDEGAETGLHFRSENVFAQGLRARRPRQRPQPPPPPAAPHWAPPPPLPQRQGRPSDPRELSGLVAAPFMILTKTPSSAVPIDLQAFNYWAHNFVYRAEEMPDMSREYTAYVLPRWDAAAPGSVLDLALSAVTHAVFGRARGSQPALVEAARLYRGCVGGAKEVVNNGGGEGGGEGRTEGKWLDDLLVASMLMAYYENTMFTGRNDASAQDKIGSRFWKNFAHHEAAAALLKLRRDKSWTANLALDRAARRQIIRVCILRGIPIPSWMHDGAEYGEEGTALDLDTLFVRLALLRSRSLNHTTDESYQGKADEARKLDDDLASWAKTLDATKWTTPGYVAIWNRYRAARMATNSIRLSCLLSLGSASTREKQSTKTQCAKCRSNISALAKDLRGGMQFFLDAGAVAASAGADEDDNTWREHPLPAKMAALMAWPLTLAVSTSSVPPADREWLAGCLQTTARALGDATLESVLERKDFKF